MKSKPSREDDELQPTATGTDAVVRDITGETHASPVAREPRTEVYVVEPGDTLEKIAHKFYGDPDEARRILDQNRERIGGSGELQAGQELEIPI